MSILCDFCYRMQLQMALHMCIDCLITLKISVELVPGTVEKYCGYKGHSPYVSNILLLL